MIPGTTRTTSVVSFVFAIVLSVAYLRTRALWVSWGLNFGWKASRALVFGLDGGQEFVFAPRPLASGKQVFRFFDE